MKTENTKKQLDMEPEIFAILKVHAENASTFLEFLKVLHLGETKIHPDPVVMDITETQVLISDFWHKKEFVLENGETAKIGCTLKKFKGRKEFVKIPDFIADSDLFRESGSNITYEDKVNEYAKAMSEYGCFGEFPNCYGRLVVISQAEIDKFSKLAKDGFHLELGYSRALVQSDLGKVIAHLQNGHHRAYAAKKAGYPFNMVVEQFQALSDTELAIVYAQAKGAATEN